MGSQRFMAEGIMSHFFVDEKQAYKLAQNLELLSLCDEISDATYPLINRGDVQSTLSILRAVRNSLGERIAVIENSFKDVKRR